MGRPYWEGYELVCRGCGKKEPELYRTTATEWVWGLRKRRKVTLTRCCKSDYDHKRIKS